MRAGTHCDARQLAGSGGGGRGGGVGGSRERSWLTIAPPPSPHPPPPSLSLASVTQGTNVLCKIAFWCGRFRVGNATDLLPYASLWDWRQQLEPVNGSGAEEVVEMAGLAWDIGWVGARMGMGGGGTVGSTEEGIQVEEFLDSLCLPVAFSLSVCLFPHHNKN